MINRWKLKDCPRCSGDIFMDIDENGWLGHCLQCGYMGRAANMLPLAQQASDTVKPATPGSILARPVYFARK